MILPDHYSDPSNYTMESVFVFDEAFIKQTIELCKPYTLNGKDKPENYSENRLRYCFENKFEYGFYIVRCKDEVVLTFGIDKYQGWGVIARYLRHTPDKPFFPCCLGYAFPEVKKRLSQRILGLCSTQNPDDRDLMGMVIKKYNKSGRGGIHDVAADTIAQVKKLDYQVIYRDNIQDAYSFSGDLVPPFDRLTDRFLNLKK